MELRSTIVTVSQNGQPVGGIVHNQAICNPAEKAALAQSNPLIDEIRMLMETFDMNESARAYYDGLFAAYGLYGNRGLRSQILYFLNNVKCSSKKPETKKAKDKLMAIQKKL